MDNKNYAVLIDADNISTRYLGVLFEELSNYGATPIRRVYGDFETKSDGSWKEKCLEHSIKQIHQYNYTTGKNASDSNLIIDAMDLLYKESYLDGFVIVSSDSDFTGLCQRLREANKDVIGMGEKKTIKPLVNACVRFIYLENLIEEEKIEKKNNNDINLKIKEIISKEDGKILISKLKGILLKLYPDFDEKNYGYNKMSKFLSEIEGLDISNTKNIGYVLLKDYDNNAKYDSIMKKIEEMLKENRELNLSEIQNRLIKEKINYKETGYSKFIKFLQSNKKLVIKDNKIAIIKSKTN